MLDEVKKEAQNVLGINDKKPDKKRDVEKMEVPTEDSQSGAKKTKKRQKVVDWSKLPPEERLRREEQRRLQKEAAERQARGEDKTPGYKHPLNSQRRRANRRKPKWKNVSKQAMHENNDHDSSGYLHRKQGAQSY